MATERRRGSGGGGGPAASGASRRGGAPPLPMGRTSEYALVHSNVSFPQRKVSHRSDSQPGVVGLATWLAMLSLIVQQE